MQPWRESESAADIPPNLMQPKGCQEKVRIYGENDVARLPPPQQQQYYTCSAKKRAPFFFLGIVSYLRMRTVHRQTHQFEILAKTCLFLSSVSPVVMIRFCSLSLRLVSYSATSFIKARELHLYRISIGPPSFSLEILEFAIFGSCSKRVRKTTVLVLPDRCVPSFVLPPMA